MEKKIDKELVERFPDTEKILEQIVNHVRRSFLQDLNEEIRSEATCLAISTGFQLYQRLPEARKLLYNYFVRELFNKVPELGLGRDIEENGWQFILRPNFAKDLLYKD